jgi:hypothetical protein
LLTIGKLIDSTFGQGTFKKIGELSSDPKEQDDLLQLIQNNK